MAIVPEQEPADRAGHERVLAARLPHEARPEDPAALARQAGPTLGWMFETDNAALQRMDLFHAIRRRERAQQLDETAHRSACCGRATQQRLHVRGSVVERPGLMIDRLPLLPAHRGVGSAGMFGVVSVEVRLQRHALAPEGLMVLRAGQRGQTEELDHVERQLLLHDRDIASDRLRRVARKAHNVPGKRHHALRLPGQQHRAILGDLVLALLRRGEIVRVDILQTDEHPCDAGTLGLRHEVGNRVTARVDLNQQAKRDALLLAQRDQAIEDRLPGAVAGEIVVGDEEFVNALRPVQAHETFDVVRRTVARRAALHVDDRAERALVRAAAAGIETGAEAERARHIPLRQERHRRALHARQVLHEVVQGRKVAVGRVAQHRVEPPFGFPREHGNAHVPARIEADRATVQHREASRHVEPSDGNGHSSLPEAARDVEGTGILVRLHADERHKPEITVTAKAGDEPWDIHARVRLVHHLDVDGHVRSKDLPLGAIGRNAVYGRERVRGEHRAPPADHVSVVVVMRRLDQHELEASFFRNGGLHHAPLRRLIRSC